jgi:hypothetical protein
MNQVFERVRGLLARRRKLAAIAIALVVVELAAAGAVAVAGRDWIDAALAEAQSDSRRGPAPGFNGSLSSPSIAAF